MEQAKGKILSQWQASATTIGPVNSEQCDTKTFILLSGCVIFRLVLFLNN